MTNTTEILGACNVTKTSECTNTSECFEYLNLPMDLSMLSLSYLPLNDSKIFAKSSDFYLSLFKYINHRKLSHCDYVEACQHNNIMLFEALNRKGVQFAASLEWYIWTNHKPQYIKYFYNNMIDKTTPYINYSYSQLFKDLAKAKVSSSTRCQFDREFVNCAVKYLCPQKLSVYDLLNYVSSFGDSKLFHEIFAHLDISKYDLNCWISLLYMSKSDVKSARISGNKTIHNFFLNCRMLKIVVIANPISQSNNSKYACLLDLVCQSGNCDSLNFLLSLNIAWTIKSWRSACLYKGKQKTALKMMTMLTKSSFFKSKYLQDRFTMNLASGYKLNHVINYLYDRGFQCKKENLISARGEAIFVHLKRGKFKHIKLDWFVLSICTMSLNRFMFLYYMCTSKPESIKSTFIECITHNCLDIVKYLIEECELRQEFCNEIDEYLTHAIFAFDKIKKTSNECVAWNLIHFLCKNEFRLVVDKNHLETCKKFSIDQQLIRFLEIKNLTDANSIFQKVS